MLQIVVFVVVQPFRLVESRINVIQAIADQSKRKDNSSFRELLKNRSCVKRMMRVVLRREKMDGGRKPAKFI